MQKLVMGNHRNRLRLPDAIHDGQLVDRKWLKLKGFYRPDVDYYLRSGGLEAVTRGVYRRPGKPLKWEAVLYSLQELGFEPHVGGLFALKEQGYAHFMEMRNQSVVELYAARALPKWLESWHNKQPQPENQFKFRLHRQAWLEHLPKGLIEQRYFGTWDWPLNYATAELAVVESLVNLNTVTDFLAMDRLFESMASLSPGKLQKTLQACGSVKANRLSGWFADRHNHAWSKKMVWNHLDMGSGKRSIVKGGCFDKKWQITIPKELADNSRNGSEQPIF